MLDGQPAPDAHPENKRRKAAIILRHLLSQGNAMPLACPTRGRSGVFDKRAGRASRH